MNSKGPKGLQLEVGARTSRLLVSSYHSFSKSSPSSFSSFLFLASCQMIFSIVYCRDLTCIYLRPLIIASQWESRGEAGGSTWEFKLLFQPHEMAAKYHNAFCLHLLFAFSLGPLCSVITLVHYSGISATERSTSSSTQFVQQTNAMNKQMLCQANEDR